MIRIVSKPVSSYGGGEWIRTTEAIKQQIYSLSPLATRELLHIKLCARTKKMELVDGFEPPACWLQISCSTSWATPAFTTLDYYSAFASKCQHLFLKFFIFFKLFIQFQVRSHILRKHVSTRKKAVRNPHHFPAQFSAQPFFIYYDDTRVKRSCVSCLHEKAWLLDPQNTEK